MSPSVAVRVAIKPVDKKRLEKLYGDSSYWMASNEPHAREVYAASGEALRILEVVRGMLQEIGNPSVSSPEHVNNAAEMALRLLGEWQVPEDVEVE